MGLTYQEKSIWGSLVIILAAFTYYVAGLVGRSSGAKVPAVDFPRLITVVITIIVVEVIYHIVISIQSRGAPKDERDRLIEARSYRTSYFILSAGLFTAIATAVWIPEMTAHVLIIVMVIAECGHFVSQLCYYRSES